MNKQTKKAKNNTSICHYVTVHTIHRTKFEKYPDDELLLHRIQIQKHVSDGHFTIP